MNSPVLEYFRISLIQKLGSRRSYNLKDSSPVFDTIPGGLSKLVQDLILKPLTEILNLSLQKCVVSAELEIAKIIPVYKDHDPAISIPPVL